MPLDGFKNSKGEQVYNYKLSDKTVQGSHNLLRQSLVKTKNDPALEGSNWHPYTGMTSVVQAPQPTGGIPSYALDFPAGSVVHGLGFDSLQVTTTPGTEDRSVTIDVDNRYLRYLGA